VLQHSVIFVRSYTPEYASTWVARGRACLLSAGLRERF